MDRVPGPLDPTRDSFDLTARELVRQGFARQFRLNLPPETLLPPTGAVVPLGVFLPPQLPQSLRELPLDQRGRGPLGAQQLQPIQLWILNPIRRMTVQVWVSPKPAPAGFVPVPAEWTPTFLRSYDQAKAEKYHTPVPPPSPTEERKVAVKASVGTEYTVTTKPSGEKEKSAEVGAELEIAWEFYEGSLGSVEVFQSTSIALKIESVGSESWHAKPPEFKQAGGVELSTPELDKWGVKWKASLTGQVYGGATYGKGFAGASVGFGVEGKVGNRSVTIKLEKGLEREFSSQGSDLPSDTVGVSLTITWESIAKPNPPKR